MPHTSDPPRSFSFNEGAVRSLAWAVGMLALALFFAVAALVVRVRTADRILTSVVEDREVDSLRMRLDSLRGSLAGIRTQESRIRATVGVTPSNAPSFWSRILRHAPSQEQLAQAQERRVATMRDSLRREIKGISTVADSLVVRAGEVNSRAQRMADSVAGMQGKRQ